MTFTRADIAKLAADEGTSELVLLSILQGVVAESGDSETLEQLCAIKSEILGF